MHRAQIKMIMNKLKHLWNTKSNEIRFPFLQVASIVVAIIATTIILNNLYKLLPQTQVWETAFFTITSNGFKNVYTLGWTVMVTKLLPLILISIWYITCRYSWSFVIMFPISYFLLQLLNILIWDNTGVDEKEYLITIPVLLAILFSLHKLRKNVIPKLLLFEIGERIEEKIREAEKEVNNNK